MHTHKDTVFCPCSNTACLVINTDIQAYVLFKL